MTEIYYPFDAGNGADVRESQWRKMARLWRPTGVIQGVLNALQVYADSSGMQVKVKTGKAFVDGFYYENDAELILSIAAAHPTYGRLDRVVLRLDVANNICSLNILAGTPSASPALTALTQSETGTWEIALATITVDAAAITIAAGKVADTRSYSFGASGSLGAADYDSGWFAVAHNTLYTKAHSLAQTPRLISVFHAAVAAPGASDEIVGRNSSYGDAAYTQEGLGADATNIYARSGNNATVGTCNSLRRASAVGYWRIQAWK